MMRRLKPRGAVDKVPKNPRSHRQAIIRWSYLIGVGCLGLFLADLFLGSFFFLRSEGLVLGEPAVVASEFAVTVRDLKVREGERVASGSIAAVVSSQTVVETLARLASDLSARQNRLSELRVRAETINAILALATTREQVAVDARKELETLLGRGLLSLDKRTAAVESEFRSRQDLESLNAERRVIAAELRTLEAAYRQSEAAVRDLRELYNEGQLRIPIDGIVSRRAADRGAVVRAGEPIVEVYGHQRFVLAYIPTGTLYSLSVGDRVEIKSGLRSAQGVITRIEPFAAALPREFQRSFAPVERQQVMRVEFAADEEVPPLFTKVQLRSPNQVPRWVTAGWRSLHAWITSDGSTPLTSSILRPALP